MGGCSSYTHIIAYKKKFYKLYIIIRTALSNLVMRSDLLFMTIESSQGTDYIVSAENIIMDTTIHSQTVLIVNGITNSCFRPCQSRICELFQG